MPIIKHSWVSDFPSSSSTSSTSTLSMLTSNSSVIGNGTANLGDAYLRFGIILSSYSLPNIVMAVVAVFMVQYLGPRVMLFIMSLTILIGSAVFAYGISTRMLLLTMLGRILLGLGGESLGIAQSRITFRWFTGAELALALGLNLSIARLGSAANDVLTPYISTTYTNSSMASYLPFESGVQAASWLGVGVCMVSFLASLVIIFLDAIHGSSVSTNVGFSCCTPWTILTAMFSKCSNSVIHLAAGITKWWSATNNTNHSDGHLARMTIISSRYATSSSGIPDHASYISVVDQYHRPLSCQLSARLGAMLRAGVTRNTSGEDTASWFNELAAKLSTSDRMDLRRMTVHLVNEAKRRQRNSMSSLRDLQKRWSVPPPGAVTEMALATGHQPLTLNSPPVSVEGAGTKPPTRRSSVHTRETEMRWVDITASYDQESFRIENGSRGFNDTHTPADESTALLRYNNSPYNNDHPHPQLDDQQQGIPIPSPSFIPPSIYDVYQFPLPYWTILLLMVSFYGATIPFINLTSDFLIVRGILHDPITAGAFMAIPDLTSIILVPILAPLVDRSGRKLAWILVAASALLFVHLIFLFAEFIVTDFIIGKMMTGFLLFGMGISHAIFSCILWPVISALVNQEVTGTAYIVAACVLNTSLSFVPVCLGVLIWRFGGGDSGGEELLGDRYVHVPAQIFMTGLAFLGVFIVCWVLLGLWRRGVLVDSKRGRMMSGSGGISGNGSSLNLRDEVRKERDQLWRIGMWLNAAEIEFEVFDSGGMILRMANGNGNGSQSQSGNGSGGSVTVHGGGYRGGGVVMLESSGGNGYGSMLRRGNDYGGLVREPEFVLDGRDHRHGGGSGEGSGWFDNLLAGRYVAQDAEAEADTEAADRDEAYHALMGQRSSSVARWVGSGGRLFVSDCENLGGWVGCADNDIYQSCDYQPRQHLRGRGQGGLGHDLENRISIASSPATDDFVPQMQIPGVDQNRYLVDEIDALNEWETQQNQSDAEYFGARNGNNSVKYPTITYNPFDREKFFSRRITSSGSGGRGDYRLPIHQDLFTPPGVSSTHDDNDLKVQGQERGAGIELVLAGIGGCTGEDNDNDEGEDRAFLDQFDDHGCNNKFGGGGYRLSRDGGDTASFVDGEADGDWSDVYCASSGRVMDAPFVRTVEALWR
ncbi:hypothetical protein HDU76_013556 [Blyttiomyces sp. JEL0837]|nr:hypothetical protein HDU76_013556 [Blyttiomyces sp. JEL0837]